MRKKEEEEEEEKRGRDGEKKDKRRCWPAKRGSKNESRRIRTHGTLTIIYSLRMRRYLLVHYIYIYSYSYSYVYCIFYILYLSLHPSIHTSTQLYTTDIHLYTLSRLQVIPLWAGAAPNRGLAPNRPTLGTAEGSLFRFVLIGPPLLCQGRASPPPSLPG